MRRMRKWYYLILLVGTGVIYLSLVDKWQVYAKPLAEVKEWYARVSVLEEGGTPDGSVEGGQVPWPDLPGTSPSTESQACDHPEEGDTGAGQGQTGEDGTGTMEGEASGEGSLDGEPGGEQGASSQPDPGQEGPAGGQEDPAAPGGEGDQGVLNQDPGEPVYMTVEDSYFADAVFIGDSRTVGMYEYGGLEEISTFYASKGLTVYKLFDAEIVPVEGQKKKITVEEALQQNSFSKIYLMIGINEMGTGTVETFVEKYKEVVDHLLELQPDAILYIQGLIKVTTARSQKGDYINNEGIVARNEALAGLADNRRTFYLDVNPMICDETGGMEASYTFDGVHLKAQYIEIWKDFLKSHAIQMEEGLEGEDYGA